MSANIPVHPVQLHNEARLRHEQSVCPQVVTLKAYEVYVHCYGEQKAMIEDGCRGGFSVSEVIAFLYAHTFPKAEWQQRVDEALRGMRL